MKLKREVLENKKLSQERENINLGLVHIFVLSLAVFASMITVSCMMKVVDN